MSRIRRKGAAFVVAASVLLLLSACTPGVTQHWRLTSDGELSTAWCDNRTIDALTVTFVANTSEGAAPSQTYTVSGPAVFVKEGQVVSLSQVAPGWTTPPVIDTGADWYAITIESTRGATVDYAGYVERVDLDIDEWVASPEGGFATVSCEREDGTV